MQKESLKQDIIQILPALRRFAFALTRSQADADDVLQATVERLIERELPKGAVLSKWAFRVCRNIWIDEYRRRQVRARASSEDILTGAAIQDIIQILPALRRFAFALTRSQADADDVLQATVERLIERELPKGAVLSKWAFRVCRNIWIDEYRRRQVRARASSEDILTGAAIIDGEKVIMDRIRLSEVFEAMGKMPEDYRAALALVAIEGFSYADSAEALGVPIGTIMSRVARARKILAEQFSDDHSAAGET